MATDITVSLTTGQVAKGLESARVLFPDATNADLIDKLEESAMFGPGIRLTVAEWDMAAVRQAENDNRAVKVDEFNAVFPPAPQPDLP